jgi:hypothetical protein
MEQRRANPSNRVFSDLSPQNSTLKTAPILRGVFPIVFAAFVLLIPPACVEELAIETPAGATFLVVDGILNNSNSADSSDFVVRLERSFNSQVRAVAVSQAKMELIVNGTTSYPMTEQEVGYYYLANKDKGIFKVGNAFKLKFTADGQNYESSEEVMPDSVPIQKIYTEVPVKPTLDNAIEVFADVQDPAQKKNYYRWSLVQFERQQYCLFCYTAPRTPERCAEDIVGVSGLTISRNPQCTGDCWDIVRRTPNNAIGDVFFDGKQLIKKQVGGILLIFGFPTLVEVRQHSLTPQYFAFLEILKTQAENTGGLADTPAALLVGNVRNVNNAKDKVLGYFSVTNTSIRRLWVPRVGLGLSPAANLNPPKEPPTPQPASWNPVPCKPSRTRTPLKPWGWQ